jgi:hypothetical protein
VFLLPLPVVNRPYLLGPWLFIATLLTPLFVRLAARGDPLFRAASSEAPAEEGGVEGDGR